MWFRALISLLAGNRSPSSSAASRQSTARRMYFEGLEDRRVLAFLAPVDYAAGTGPTDLKAGDFNGDAVLDLAVGNYGSPGVSLLLGNTNGTFQPSRSTHTAYPLSMAAGDFNNDGKLDLATRSDYEIGGRSINVLLSRGDGTFTHAGSPTLWEWSSAIATGDLNEDGNLDLVMTAVAYDGSSSYVEVMLGHGDGTFTSNAADSYTQDLTSLVLADVNGDGHTDVAARGTVLLGNGDGTLQEPSELSDVDLWSLTADFNGDGYLDQAFVSRGSTGLLGVSLGDGAGSFAPPIWMPAGPYPTALAVADFNGDGRPDAAVTNDFAGKVRVLLNDGRWSDSDPPVVSIGDASMAEGNTGTTSASFTVSLSNSTNVAVTVRYATTDITAVAGSDYTASSGTVIIPAGQTTATFTVAVKGDRLVEPSETFAVTLSSPTNATIGDGQAVGTIVDNEPRINISDAAAFEGKRGKTTLLTFTVTLSVAYDQPVTVSFRTVDGTAKAGEDFSAKSGTLTFAPGQTSKTINIEVKGDSKREANETFYLDLFGNSNNSLFTKSRGTGTILNDD